jgi:CheY-like chemotaxis protein
MDVHEKQDSSCVPAMKVLYLEDNAQDADLVQIELRTRAPDIELDIVCTLGEALARLEDFKRSHLSDAHLPDAEESACPAPGAVGVPHYDLVLTDLNLPDGSAENFVCRTECRQCRFYNNGIGLNSPSSSH